MLMNNLIKMSQYSRILVCLCLMVTAISCQRENYENDFLLPESKLDLKFEYSKVDFSQVPIKNQKALDRIMDKSLRTNYQRNDDVSQSFSIDTSNVVRLDVEDQYTSHTFTVINEMSTNKLQNIVISDYLDNTSSIYLVEYTLDILSDDLVGGNIDDHILETNYYDVEDSSLNYLNRIEVEGDGADCVDINSYIQNFCEDSNGNTIVDNGQLGNGCSQNWTTQTVTVITIDAGCLSGGSGGGSTGTDGGTDSGGNTGSGTSGGGGNGTGTSGGDTDTGGNTGSGTDDGTEDENDLCLKDNDGNCIEVVTLPLQQLNKDLKALKKLTDNTQIKEKITFLNEHKTGNREYGFQFNRSGNSAIYDNIPEGVWVPEEEAVVFPQATSETELELHLHENGRDEAFSAEDVFQLTKQFKFSQNTNATSILVTKKRMLAMRVSDPIKADNYYQHTISVGTLAIREDYKKRIIKRIIFKAELDGHTTITEQQYMSYMVELLAEYLDFMDIGLTLYEANIDAQGNVTSWEKVD